MSVIISVVKFLARGAILLAGCFPCASMGDENLYRDLLRRDNVSKMLYLERLETKPDRLVGKLSTITIWYKKKFIICKYDSVDKSVTVVCQ